MMITYIFGARDAHPFSTASTASTAAAQHTLTSRDFNLVWELCDIDFALSLGSGDDRDNTNSFSKYWSAFWVTRVIDSKDTRTKDKRVKVGTIRERSGAKVTSRA